MPTLVIRDARVVAVVPAGAAVPAYVPASLERVQVDAATLAALRAKAGQNGVMPDPRTVGLPVIGTEIPALAFRSLFTEAELAAVYVAAHAAMGATPPDPRLQMWLDASSAATVIDLGSPLTRAGLDALVVAGLLTPERAAAILANRAPPATASS